MSKKRIIALITVIVLLFATGISVGVFMYTRGTAQATNETQSTDQNQVADGNNQLNNGTQAGENNENQNPVTTPDNNNENPVTPDNGTENNNTTVDNENANNGATNNNNVANNNNAANNAGNAGNNAGVTTDTDVNNVGETTIERIEEQERLVSRAFWDWWKPMDVALTRSNVTASGKLPQITAKKSAITGVGGDKFVFAGQDITYVIAVTNNGDTEVQDIEITDKVPQNTTFVSIEDAMIDDEIVGTTTAVEAKNVVVGAKWVVTIPAGKTVIARFTVNVNKDVTGTISNVAIANGEESKDPTNDPDEGNETKTAVITSNKTSVITRNDEEVEVAKIGDLITYTITVENTGDVEGTTYITDTVPAGTEFVSAGEGAIVSEEKDALVWSVEVGANETVTRTFTVKVSSVEQKIENVANVGGTDTNTDTTETAGIDVVKTATLVNNKVITENTKVRPEDVITYTITVENTGTTILKNIVVTDDLLPDFEEKIASLDPKETKTYTVEYTVKQSDVDNNTKITNVATSTADDGTTDTDTEETVETDKTADFTTLKTAELTKKDGNTSEKAEVGDTITYTITVKNTGSITLENIAVVDEMIGLDEKVTLVANETRTFTENHVVDEKDIAKAVENDGKLLNIATVKFGDKTEEPSTSTDVKTEYNLTINYVYENGTTAEETYTNTLIYNENYDVTSPVIPGYTPDKSAVTGTMPASDVEVTVIYKANTDTKYKVEHYLQNLDGNGYTLDATENKEGTTGAQTEAVAKNYPGFTAQPFTQKVINGDGTTVVKIYYNRAQIDYTVNYFYDGIQDDSKTETLAAIYGDTIKTYPDKNIKGYKLDRTENLPLEITSNAENNVINVYYVRNNFNYTVKYYYDGKIDNSKTETSTALYGDKVEEYRDKNITGYRLDKVETVEEDGVLPLVITENAENNVIEVYYVKANFAYTVEYYKDGETIPFATSGGEAEFESQITRVDTETNKPSGYELEKTEGLPLTISAVTANNVIKVYYAKPDIKITKTALNKTANVGEKISYRITLDNNGKVAGTATVTDILPEGLTDAVATAGSINNGTLTWEVEVPANGHKELIVTATVAADQIGKTISNTATLSDDTPSSSSDRKTSTAETKINEITGVEIATKQGEQGKDSVNVVLVMDLSSSMNKNVYKFVECTHEHKYEQEWYGQREYCPERCTKQKNGTWGQNVYVGTRLSIAKKAAQDFINKIYSDSDSKVTVTVITFNDKTGSNKYVGTKVLTFGTNNTKTTATNKDYKELVTEIGKIDIGTETSGYGTHIKAALDTTYTTIYGEKGLTTKYPNNSNTVIFLGDGDPTPISFSGFSDNTKNNIYESATNIKKAGATINSIGFGSDAIDPNSDAYEVLQNISSNNKVYTAEDAESLAEIFTNLEGELQLEKPVKTDSGKISITLEKNLVVDANNPITVEYKGKQLFSCTSMDSLSNYNLAYNSVTKTLTFDVNAYNANPNNTTKITENNKLIIRYFIER